MKIICSECGKRIKKLQKFRKVEGKNMCENCFQKLGGDRFYTKLIQLKTGSKKPVFPLGYHMIE